jgi:hypothetical protein
VLVQCGVWHANEHIYGINDPFIHPSIHSFHRYIVLIYCVNRGLHPNSFTHIHPSTHPPIHPSTIVRSQANVVLESIGNAKTITNDNSSRFGKFVQLEYDAGTQTICSAVTRHFLLEKTRVTSHAVGGRNYHLFYQLCAAFHANSDELDSYRDAGFTLLPAHQYNYLVAEPDIDEVSCRVLCLVRVCVHWCVTCSALLCAVVGLSLRSSYTQ